MPNTLVIDGKKYAIPEGKTAADIYGMVKGTSGSSEYKYTQVAPSTSIFGSIDPETLTANKDWLHASNELYKMYYGRDFEGPEKDLAEYGLDQMGWFNYNLPRMALDANSLRNAPPQAQKAFLYLMDTYDNLEITWSGVGRFIKGASADPTTYVGLGTLGIGTAGSQATKVATKQGIKSLIRAGVTAGIEGAAFAGVSDAARQSVEISAGRQDEFDSTRLVGNMAIGAGAGAILGGALDAGATALRKAPVEEVVGSTTPPSIAGNTAPPAAQAPATTSAEQLSMDLVQPEMTQQTEMFSNLPYERRLDELPASVRPPMLEPKVDANGQPVLNEPTVLVGNKLEPDLEHPLYGQPVYENPNSYAATEERIRQKWGIADTSQGQLDLGKPPEGAYAYSGQGELFSRDGLPNQNSPATMRPKLDENGEVVLNQPERWDAESRKMVPDTDNPLYGKPVMEEVSPEATEAAYKAAKGGTKETAKEVTKKAKEAAAKQVAGGPRSKLQDALDFVESLHNQSDGNAGEKIIEAIKNVLDENGWRILPGGKQEISEKVKEAAELLIRLDVSNADDAKTLLDSVTLGHKQRQGLVAALQDAAIRLDEMRRSFIDAAIGAKTKSEAAYFLEQEGKIAKAQDVVGKLDIDASSGSGASLGMRRNTAITGSRRAFYSPEEIMRRNPGMTIEEARLEYIRAAVEHKAKAVNDERVKKLSAEIERLFQANDYANVAKKIAERNALINDIAAEAAGEDRHWFTKASAKLSEAAVGNAFAVSSVVVNTLPSMVKLIYKPTLNALVDNRSTLRTIGASYSAMFAQSRAALNAAKAVFNLEINPTFATRNDFLTGTPEIKGTLGRVIRLFPRFLEATDAYFSRVHYAGFVAAETYNDAADALIKQGIKPGSRKFKAEIDKVMKSMQDNLFTNETDVVEVADTLYQIGTSRGYTGKKLEEFIKLELGRNKELFQKATNVAGRDYAVDALFKREFSGDNYASKVAKKYEQVMNAHPLMRLGFQLFVRTPIRVFEEGFRLTPGLNMASSIVGSKFLDDLKGLNGASRQIRAHGEALLSMAFGGAVLGLYANGMITGGGPTDYKQRRGKENDREWQPYTIYLPGGTTISYRNLDPFATPLKIMVNALDRFQMYQFRSAQGEYADSKFDETMALLGVSGGSVLQAVKDANLTEGLSQMADLVNALMNPEENENFIANFFNEKAKLLIPNAIGKTRQLVSGEETPMANIATTPQALSQRFNPFDETVPTQRDALGNKRYMGYSIPSYFGIGVNTSMEKNISDKEQAVLKALADIQTINNVNFELPYKIDKPGLSGIDLRSKYLPDNKTTYYDRIYDIYKSLGVADALYQGLIVNGDLLTEGVADPNKYGTKVKFAKDTIEKYRNLAVLQFMRENEETQVKAFSDQLGKLQAKQGAFDVPLIPQ